MRVCGAHVRTRVRTSVRACDGACMYVRLHVRALDLWAREWAGAGARV